MLVEHGELASRDASSAKLVGETQLGQLPHGMRKHVDADTKLLDSGGRLEHVNISQSRRMQRQGQRHATDTTACDEDPHTLGSRTRIRD